MSSVHFHHELTLTQSSLQMKGDKSRISRVDWSILRFLDRNITNKGDNIVIFVQFNLSYLCIRP